MANAADEIVGIYRRHARSWSRARGKRLPERNWIDRFSDMLRPGGQVLDLGCGSGEPIARYLSERGYRITGVDSSPEMIEMFETNLPPEEAIVADMRSLHLDRCFDGVLAWDSFFHLRHDDQRRMFAIFRGHSRTSAPLMFTSGPAHGEAIGTLEGDPLYHSSLDPAEYVQLLDSNGFEVIAHVAEDPTCGGRTIWLAQCR